MLLASRPLVKFQSANLNVGQHMAEILVLEFHNWRQFKSDLVYDLFKSEDFRHGAFIFRGHRDADWKLESSFDRWLLRFPHLDRIETADKLLKLFKKECAELEIGETIMNDDVKALAL